MKIDDCFELGYISKPHALQGEVSLVLEVDDPSPYVNLGSVFLEEKNGLVPYFIESLLPQTNRFIIKFEEIDTVEEARELSGSTVYLPLALLPKLAEGQFFYHEVIGFTVKDAEKGKLGEIFNVFSTDMQALLAMQYKGKEVLIPITDETVLEVQREAQVVRVALPKGLLEIYLNDEIS